MYNLRYCPKEKNRLCLRTQFGVTISALLNYKKFCIGTLRQAQGDLMLNSSLLSEGEKPTMLAFSLQKILLQNTKRAKRTQFALS